MDFALQETGSETFAPMCKESSRQTRSQRDGTHGFERMYLPLISPETRHSINAVVSRGILGADLLEPQSADV
jgi:hypothetical protein